MNFAASFETAKNTQWCSQSLSGYSMWNKMSIMFRIIPKDKSFDKLKLTWLRCNKSWFLSCSKYPEIQGEGSPFDIEDNKEMWLIRKIKMDNDAGEKWKENSKNIEKTMGLVSDNAKEYIVKYYKEHGQN